MLTLKTSKLNICAAACWLLLASLWVGCRSISGEVDAFFEPPSWPVHAVEEAPQLDVEGLEQRVHAVVNEVRQEAGLKPLVWADPLRPVARSHSRDMADRAYFAHLNPDGEDAHARAQRIGLECREATAGTWIEGLGENLFLTHRYAAYYIDESTPEPRYLFDWKTEEEIARQAVSAWLESRSHRVNLLSPLYESGAIGVAVGEQGIVLVTQNLCSEPDLSGPILAEANRSD